jgi:hypothetical protein
LSFTFINVAFLNAASFNSTSSSGKERVEFIGCNCNLNTFLIFYANQLLELVTQALSLTNLNVNIKSSYVQSK